MTTSKAAAVGAISGITAMWGSLLVALAVNGVVVKRRRGRAKSRAAHPAGSKLTVVGDAS